MSAVLILLAIAIGYALLGIVTWLQYCALMKMRDRLPYLPPMAAKLGRALLWIGYAFDFTFNVASSVTFFELPREWAFSARVERHHKSNTRRGAIARWFRDTWLNSIDPEHVK